MTAKQRVDTLTACDAGCLHKLESGFGFKADHPKASYRKASHRKASYRRGREMTDLPRRDVCSCVLKAAAGATR